MSKYGVSVKDTMDSSKNHMLVDLNASPKHFDTLRLVGSALSVNATTLEEIVAKVAHNLGYTPMCAAYMYQDADVTPSTVGVLGTYYRNFYSYVNLGGVIEDSMYIKADDTYLYFVHRTSAPFAYTSPANTTPVVAKYYIFQRPAYNNPRYS